MLDQSSAVFGGRIEDLPMLDAASLAPGVEKRIIFGPGRFWNDYVVRYFTLPPRMKNAAHAHDWMHYVLVVAGHGRVVSGGEEIDLTPGSWAYVKPGPEHFFENLGDEPFSFICMVPVKGDPDAGIASDDCGCGCSCDCGCTV